MRARTVALENWLRWVLRTEEYTVGTSELGGGLVNLVAEAEHVDRFLPVAVIRPATSDAAA